MHSKFAVFDGNDLIHDGVTYNHATGILYRSQGFHRRNELPRFSTFEIQDKLTQLGKCRVGTFTAVSWKLTGGPMVTLAASEEAEKVKRVGTAD